MDLFLQQNGGTILGIISAVISALIGVYVLWAQSRSKIVINKSDADKTMIQAEAQKIVNDSTVVLRLVDGFERTQRGLDNNSASLDKVASTLDSYATAQNEANKLTKANMDLSKIRDTAQQIQLAKIADKIDQQTSAVGSLNTTITDVLSQTASRTTEMMEKIEGYSKEAANQVIKGLEPMQKDIKTIFEQIEVMKNTLQLLTEIAIADAKTAETLKQTTATLSDQLGDLQNDVRRLVNATKTDEPASTGV